MSDDSRAAMETLRSRIDDIDARLVQLLSERAQCALGVGELKRALGMAIYQPAREADVLNHVCDINEGPLDNEAIRRLFERIIDEARRLERIAAGGPADSGTVRLED